MIHHRGAEDTEAALKSGLAAEVLRSRGELRLQVTGASMLPAVWPGDVLSIRSCAPHELRLGEIVLVEHEGGFRVHRLVREEDGGARFITRGDAMPQDDPAVDAARVLGKVTSIERGGRRISPKAYLKLLERLTGAVASRSSLWTRGMLWAAKGRSI